jgi:hypothetical protein
MKHKLTFNPDGAEPIVLNADGVAAVRVLNWYNVNMTRDDVIKALSSYAKHTMYINAADVTAAASNLADAPQTAASIVAAWAAGSTFKDQDHAEKIVRDTITKAVAAAKERKASLSDWKVMAMARKRHDAAVRSDAYWQLSDFVDDAGYGLRSHQPIIPNVSDANVAKDILPHFERRATEMEEAVKDREGYEGINVRSCLKAAKAVVDMLRHAVTSGVVAASRKPRKFRPLKKKSPAAQVAKLKYLANWGAIQSINPTRLIGCKLAFLYDTKARKLIRFTSESGMTVRGSHLDGEATSKKIRKPDDEIPKFIGGTAAVVRREFETIKTKATAARTMINSNMVILKAV